MKKIYDSIKDNPLFSGIGFSDFEKMYHCIKARLQVYNKDEIILMSGDEVNFVGLIISGRVKILKEELNGNTLILTELKVSELFGEAFACAGINRSPVTVQTSEKSEILFINYRKVIDRCSSSCGFHLKLIENMLKLLAKKNLILNQKIEVLSKRTIRDKLFAFFDMQRGMEKKFTVPYNREEMASFLCIDRSALSKELCKMRDEKLIRFNKNKFELLD